jgi:FMN phosphatase YigB (HAD superfamily)
LGIQPEECIFVGDHPQWDYEGSRAAGMIPVLIAHEHALSMDSGYMIRTLSELPGLLKGI